VTAIRAGEIAGANVTVPHKRLALSLADEVDDSAAGVGAANVLAPRPGPSGSNLVAAHNTDVVALAGELSALAGSVRRAVVIGSGGAALGAVAACRRLGAEHVAVVARGFRSDLSPSEWTRAAELSALGAEPMAWSNDAEGAWCRAAREADVVVQATSAGMKGADSGASVADIVPWGALRDAAVAYDVVYNPPVTPFSEAARARGLRVATGLGMLVGQAAHAVAIWLSVEPPVAAMRAAAERALFGRSPP
jgi:shikimate dehydrogenase